MDSVQMTLTTAKVLAALVERRAAESGVNAVICVCNDGANPVYAACMDGSYLASYDIALNKAFTAVSLQMSTEALKPLAQPGGSLYGIQHTNGGRIVIFGGGVPLEYGGRLVGGLGVSGGTEAQDTALAEYGRSVFETVVKTMLAK